ncbi:hypothetical protein EV356DRAFT_503828 [Viridothelium virens]|uniref:Sister chromatid cohesion protein Ctf8 n=1 Tax=Viridothelium virens TaxID=1048519 RepID=A0A6A6H5V2_VIRVR|nr:hypothetical protein EV356DRAFT_503828 [Viridothelium virens]
MPSIPIYPPNPNSSPSLTSSTNPLPPLLHTPTGLAILEIQGTINFPSNPNPDPTPNLTPTSSSTPSIPIGHLVFPDDASTEGRDTSGKHDRRVYLYVGKHQRLTGEMRELGKPLGVLRKRERGEELEIVEVVRWKVMFASRPEPVGE